MGPNLFGIAEAEVVSVAEAKLKKSDEYMEYINTHIANVQRAFEEISNKLLTKVDKSDPIYEAIMILRNRISSHDESKYSDEEFEAYRKNFYPINDEEREENRDAFELAWKHHYASNSHHPEHWIDAYGDPINMSVADVIEMICDWESFKYIDKGSAKEWWEKRGNSIVITGSTRDLVTRVFTLLEW